MRFILIISLLAILFANLTKPDYVETNEYMVRQCSVDMTLNKDIICD